MRAPLFAPLVVAVSVAVALPLLACGGSTPPASPPAAPPPEPAAPAEPAASSPTAAPSASETVASAPLDAGAAAEPAPMDAGAAEDAGPAYDYSVVERVVKEHKDALRVACWDKSKSTEKAYAGTMTIRVGPTGKVASVKTEGTDATASACIDKQVKAWTFPPPKGTATIKAPIRLRRD